MIKITNQANPHQPTLLSATFHLPLFTPNHLLLHFHPGPHLPLVQTNLPDPGRGGKIEAKVVVGEGAGHAVWKRIEGERGRWAERRREEEILREFVCLTYVELNHNHVPRTLWTME